MRVLLTGAAGFIGGAIATRLHAAGDEVVGVDLMLPQAHGEAAAAAGPPDGVHRLDVRDAATSGAAGEQWAHLLDGVDVVCHQSAMVGAGVRVGDLPDYAGHNDLGTAALLAAMHAAGVDRLVVASSMVVYGEGRYECPEHGERQPPPRTLAALQAGDFDNHCPDCDRPLAWRLVPESAALDPRSSYAASKLAQEHYASAWVRQADAAAVALRYHNVYGPLMPRDTPYSGVAAMFRSSLERGEAPTVYEDGAQMRDFVHVEDVARANELALRSVVGGEHDRPGRFAAYNVCSGMPVSILDVAREVAAGRAEALGAQGAHEDGGGGEPVATPEPVVTGGFRPGDVRHVVASPDLAAAELGFTAEIAPADGLRAFATAPLRA